jgi:hypothetical protein
MKLRIACFNSDEMIELALQSNIVLSPIWFKYLNLKGRLNSPETFHQKDKIWISSILQRVHWPFLGQSSFHL